MERGEEKLDAVLSLILRLSDRAPERRMLPKRHRLLMRGREKERGRATEECS